MVKHLLALLIALLPAVGFAQTENSNQEHRDLLVFDDSATGVQAPSEATELELKYDGLNVDAADLPLPESKDKLLLDLEKELYEVKDLRNSIYFPRAPTNLDELEIFKALSFQEMKTFLRKKETFLRRFGKTLSFFKLKNSWISKALAEVNSQFYRSSKLIANSNTAGGTLMFSAGAGLALPTKIVPYLKTKPIGRFIPESGGFYYMLGLGAGVVRVVDPKTKKSNLYLELFLDTEKLTKTLTGLVEATAAGTMGVVYEHRESDFWSQKVDVNYGGLAGLFLRGDTHFGWAASLGVSAPPFIGAVLVYTNEATRRYFMRMNITKVFIDIPGRLFSEIAGRTRSLRARSCSRVY